jgi:hypothetical protein
VILARVEDRFTGTTLEEISRRSKQLAQVFQRLREPLKKDQADHADKEEGPEGSWPARKPTERRRVSLLVSKKRKKGKVETTVTEIKGLLGALPEVLQIRASRFQVWARSPVRWASAQFHGGRVGRGSLLPPRPFVWVSPELAAHAAKMIADFAIGDAARSGGRGANGRFTSWTPGG